MRRWSTKQIGRTLILQFLKLIFVAWEMCTFCFWSILALLLLNYNKLFLFWNVIKLTIQSNLVFFFFSKFHYIIFGSKHMWRFFSICGSYVMQVVRHLVVYRCWARKQNMSVFLWVGVGCFKVGSTACWIVFLMCGGCTLPWCMDKTFMVGVWFPPKVSKHVAWKF